ncbi:MAG: hypothetical protein U5L11_06845 [Arhodomonas sp.]|nr:hypothetical protein [Arhodomonas sp.]
MSPTHGHTIELPLGRAEVLREGRDVTPALAWSCPGRNGDQRGRRAGRRPKGIDCEVIDLRTQPPWDVDTVAEATRRPAAWLVSNHEAAAAPAASAPSSAGHRPGARPSSTWKSPICPRLPAWTRPFPLAHERRVPAGSPARPSKRDRSQPVNLLRMPRS